LLQTTLEQALRLTRYPEAVFEERQNGVILRIDVEDLEWAARFLAGLGIPLVIHHPPELREALRQYGLSLISYAERLETEEPAQEQ